MKSFVTGSQVYGISSDKSDVDLVVLVSKRDMERLERISDQDANRAEDHYDMDTSTTACLRFGKLNLICVTYQSDFVLWKEGTEELIAKRPVSRDEAVEHFRRKRLGDTNVESFEF